MKKLLEIYRLEMISQNLSEYTIKNTMCRLSKFCDYVGTPDKIDKMHINQYISTLRQRLKEQSVNEHIKTIRKFIKYLYDEEYIDKRINIKSYKVDKIVQEQVLSDERIKEIIEGLKKQKKNFFSVRNLTIVSMLADTGIRLSELCNLRICDINDNTMTVSAKRKQRIVPISPKLNLQIHKYLIARESFCGSNTDNNYLFVSRSSRQLTSSGVQMILNNIDSNLHPHMFRHYYIQSLLKSGVNIYYIARVVGHESINTTEVYLRSMKQSDIINNIINHTNL